MGSRTLNATSFAVLGLLAIKDWGIYELTQQAQHNFRYFWLRADSNLYEAAKSLVDHGLAQNRSEPVGRRPRTVYSITPAGRRALAKWVGRPGPQPVMMWETLLKVFFAEHATRQELLNHLESARLAAEETQGHLRSMADAHACGEVPFPERLAQSTLIFRLLWQQSEVLRQWALFSTEEVSTWPDDPTQWPGDHRELQRITDKTSRRRGR